MPDMTTTVMRLIFEGGHGGAPHSRPKARGGTIESGGTYGFFKEMQDRGIKYNTAEHGATGTSQRIAWEWTNELVWSVALTIIKRARADSSGHAELRGGADLGRHPVTK